MKKSLLIAALLLAAAAGPVAAQPPGLGVGLVIGEPTGITLKKWLAGNTALQGALAWSIRHNVLYLHADYVFHSFGIFPVSPGRLPLYYGFGGRFIAANDPGVGARIVVGLNYLFPDAPVDAFLELAPVVNLIPDTDFDLSGGLGLRYFF